MFTTVLEAGANRPMILTVVEKTTITILGEKLSPIVSGFTTGTEMAVTLEAEGTRKDRLKQIRKSTGVKTMLDRLVRVPVVVLRMQILRLAPVTRMETLWVRVTMRIMDTTLVVLATKAPMTRPLDRLLTTLTRMVTRKN